MTTEKVRTTRLSGPDGGARRRRIALVAHDDEKEDLLEWARYNRDVLARHDLFATGSTGRMLADELDLPVHTHLHETEAEIAESARQHGTRPLARLDRLGLVSERLLAVHANRTSAHLVREHERTDKAGKHKCVNTGRIPPCSEERLRPD